LHQQALRARVDQAGAELRQIEDADDEREQPDDVEQNDAPGEARRALRDDEAECRNRGREEPAQPSADGTSFDIARAFLGDGRRDGRRSFGGSIQHLSSRPLEEVAHPKSSMRRYIYRSTAKNGRVGASP
jgi:hypothetical protein